MSFFPKIIAVAGLKGSGKNTVADLIKEQYSNYFPIKTVAFADPIRKKVEFIFKLDGSDQMYDSFKHTCILFTAFPGWCTDRLSGGSQNSSGRHVLREIGMLMRSYDENQFVKYVDQTISNGGRETCWIITDLRFQNELDYLKEKNAYIIKIERSKKVEDYYNLDKKWSVNYGKDTHPTEQGIDSSHCNLVLTNEGTIEDLKEKIKQTFDHFIK